MTHRSLLLATGLSAVVAFPAAASAGQAAVGGGLTVVKPSRALHNALGRSGTRLSASGPVKYTAGIYALPVTGGQFALMYGGGTVATVGSLRFRHAGHSVTISRLELTLGPRSAVTAAVDGHRMTVFKVSRRRAHAAGNTNGRVITGLRLTPTPMAAAVIDSLLTTHALSSHGVAAVADLIVEPQPASAPGGSGSSTGSPDGSLGSGTAPSSAAPGGGADSSGPLGLPGVPGLPAIPGLPGIPGLSGLTGGLPGLPSLPPMPVP
jgi:hypothetical protein